MLAFYLGAVAIGVAAVAWGAPRYHIPAWQIGMGAALLVFLWGAICITIGLM